MAERQAQSFANHAKLVPLFHFVLFGMLFLNLIYRFVRIFRAPSLETGFSLLLAVAFLLLFYYLRTFALQAQDRVIRLEEQLRLRDVLGDDLRPRIPELAPSQLIGLRFASDEELPDLVRRVLDQELKTRREIKQQIKSWRADHMRL